jgi:hypothetical protein
MISLESSPLATKLLPFLRSTLSSSSIVPSRQEKTIWAILKEVRRCAVSKPFLGRSGDEGCDCDGCFPNVARTLSKADDVFRRGERGLVKHPTDGRMTDA